MTVTSTWLRVFVRFGEKGVTAPEPGISLLRTYKRFRSFLEDNGWNGSVVLA